MKLQILYHNENISQSWLTLKLNTKKINDLSLVVLQLNMHFYVCIEQIALFFCSKLPNSAPAQYDISLVCINDTSQ